MRRRISLTTLIRENRALIDAEVRRVGGPDRLNDAGRREWILNHDLLYYWAKAQVSSRSHL